MEYPNLTINLHVRITTDAVNPSLLLCSRFLEGVLQIKGFLSGGTIAIVGQLGGTGLVSVCPPSCSHIQLPHLQEDLNVDPLFGECFD